MIQYCTRQLVIYFNYIDSKSTINCTVYTTSGENWKVLQSYNVKNSDYESLTWKEQQKVHLQMIRYIHKNMTKALSKVLAF